jgi:uncharacterized membrane protein
VKNDATIFLTPDDQEAKVNDISWTVAIFATIFAVVMAVLWISLYNSGTPALPAIGGAFAEGWLMILVALVLCGGTYLGYYLYINRKT